MAMDYQGRLNKVRDLIRARKLDGLIIKNMANIRYLTGFTGSTGALLIASNLCCLYLDFRYFRQGSEESHAYCSVVKCPGEDADFFKDIQKRFKKKCLGFESDSFNYYDYEKICRGLPDKKLTPVLQPLKYIRSIKEPAEIKNIRKAVKIAQQAFDWLCGIIKPGMCEKDLACELDYGLKKNGAQKASFDVIVLEGRRTSLPHGQPGERRIKNNSLVLLDFGAVYQGYHSDLTRVLALGRMPRKFKKVFNIVNEAKNMAIESICSGMQACDVDSAARRCIASKGWGEFFGHGLGHGLGLDIHEAPVLSPKSKDIIAPNMTFTIEPGIYVPGLGGIRLEEDCITTLRGCRTLSVPQNEIIEI